MSAQAAPAPAAKPAAAPTDAAAAGTAADSVKDRVAGAANVRCDVVIVGAGLAGLSAAEFLLEHDPSLEVIVLEAAEKVGGRLQGQPLTVASVGSDGAGDGQGAPHVTFDVGGEWILPEQKNVMQLVDRLGLRTFPNGGGSDGTSGDLEGQGQQQQQQPLKRLTQMGRRSKIRNSRSGLSVLRSWLSGVDVAHVVWKLDALSRTMAVGVASSGGVSSDPFWSTPGAAHLDAMTVHTYLERTCYFQSTRDIFAIKLRFLCGVDPAAISLLFLLTYANSQAESFSHFFHDTKPVRRSSDGVMVSEPVGPPVRIASGAFSLCDRLAETLPSNIIHFNQPVHSIVTMSQGSDDVTGSEERSVCVTSLTGQSFTCRRVICAVPPPTLARHLEFHPPLPPLKRKALNSMRAGDIIKFVLTYDETYWIDSGFSGEFLSNGGRTTMQQLQLRLEGSVPITMLCDATTCQGVPALVGFLGGRQAVQWASAGLARTKAAILDALAVAFGGTWVRDPVDFYVKDWSEEPFGCGGGSACVPTPGTMDAFHTLPRAAGHLHFAGTETASEYYGTISGAVQSGQRAAVEVLYEIKPQSLSSNDLALTSFNNGLEAAEAAAAIHRPFKEPSVTGFLIKRPLISLSLMALGAGILAVRMRNQYSQLFRPHF